MKKKCITILALALSFSMLFSTPAQAGRLNENPEPVQESSANSQTNLVTGYYKIVSNPDASRNDLIIANTIRQVANRQTVTYTQANQVASLVQLGYYSVVTNGPVSITEGSLKYKNYGFWTSKPVYLVCLSGTDHEAAYTYDQTTGYWTDLLSGFEQDNQYLRNVVSIIKTLPKNSNLIIAGHSLGGMIAQQVAADEEIKSNYNVMNTVTFGSPLIDGLSREGMVKRLGDTTDVVPFMSLSSFTNIVWQYEGLNKEDGHYGSTELLAAHCESYQRPEVWKSYDPCGENGAGRELTLDFSTTKFYHSSTHTSK